MSLLYLSDILKRAGLDLKRTKLIRHSLNDKGFRDCFDADNVKEYTQRQNLNFSKDFDYWVVFISDKGTSCKLYACYKVNGCVSDMPDVCPPNFLYPEWFTGESGFYDLEEVDLLKELEGRLIIDWGKATVSWHQKATNEKAVLAIQAKQKVQFVGYENVLLSYQELQEIISDSIVYENWHTALSAVSAVYLIADKRNGALYVGSAYGEGGLLSRWASYVQSKHGGNKGMKEVLVSSPERYQDFQFSILQVFSKTATSEEVIQTEMLYKKKLLTTMYGMNRN